jgi:hypothetical protein
MKASEFVFEKWSQKYKSSINCSHPKGFSQKAHCAGKNKQNESVEMEMVCETCGMCKTHGSLNEIAKGVKDSNGYTKCWPGKHAEGTKKGKNGGQVRNCVPNESVAESTEGRCRQCGMKNCKCPGDSCKCKPIAGWVPNKGFRKAVEEDLSRRGFLKGMGAATVAGAAGGAKADWERQQDFVDKLSGDKEIRFVNISPDSDYFLRFVSTGQGPVFYIGGLNFHITKSGKGRIKIDNGKVHTISFVPTDDKTSLYSSKIQPLDVSITDLSKEIFSAKQKILIDVTEVTPGAPEERQRVATFIPKFSFKKESVNQGMAEDLEDEFDLIESIIEGIAEQNGVDAEAVWADLESLTEDELYAFAVTSQLNEDWQKANKRDKTDGMSQKAVNSYRREHPGSKLKTAVTTKPSKLKKGSKASKRRKSYCSRSRGQMKMHNISCAKTPDKAICKARRRWNC